MKEIKEIGKFYGHTFNGVIYVFSVKDNNMIYLEKVQDEFLMEEAYKKYLEYIEKYPKYLTPPLFEYGNEYLNSAIDAPMKRIYLSPRFLLANPYQEMPGKTNYFRLNIYKDSKYLIEKYTFDEGVFEYMKENNMIYYSTDMAYLYDLPIKEGYDYYKKSGRPYKHALKKGPILVKQKKGIYN